MNRKHNRDKQAAVLRQVQEQRKQEKREQVFRAIEEIQRSRQSLTFPNIAKIAGCSVSYLYKWTELTAYIHDLQNQKNQQLNLIEEKEPGPHSLKTLHEVSKQRIRELEAENRELKRQNEKLRGHVADIFELRSECERLRTQLRQLTHREPSVEIVPLHSPLKTKEKTEPLLPVKLSIEEELKQLGIPLNSTLAKTIKTVPEEKVLEKIQMLKNQLKRGAHIPNAGGWLNNAIRKDWTEVPQCKAQKPSSPDDSSTPTDVDANKSLLSPDHLKSLSHIFNKTHDLESSSPEH